MKNENFVVGFQTITGGKKMNFTDSMNLSDFRLFQKIIYNEAGINLTEKKLTLLSNRIQKRLKALDISSFHEYHSYVTNSIYKEKEMGNLIDSVTTNVTNFFRNPRQFNILKSTILPDIIKTKSKIKSIKILSAGCSTGEEPYSIALTLLEYYEKLLKDWKIRIDGYDICSEAIIQAQNGTYKGEQLSNINNCMLRQYFTPSGDGNFQINNKIKSPIDFKKFNLKTDVFSSKYDIIFCRNVVIYFDKEIKNKLYWKLFNALNDKGYLFIGHSEGLINDDRFQYRYPGIYTKNNQYKISNRKSPGEYYE